MNEAQANELLIEQLKRHLAEVMEENELLKLSEQHWMARAKKAESRMVDSRISCRI